MSDCRQNNSLIKKGFLTLFLIIICFTLVPVDSVMAVPDVTNSAINILDETAQTAKIIEEIPTTTKNIWLAEIIGNGINFGLTIISIVFFCYFLYGAYKWMTANGEAEKVTIAVKVLTRSVVGLAVVAMAFLITNYVIFKLILDYKLGT